MILFDLNPDSQDLKTGCRNLKFASLYVSNIFSILIDQYEILLKVLYVPVRDSASSLRFIISYKLISQILNL